MLILYYIFFHFRNIHHSKIKHATSNVSLALEINEETKFDDLKDIDNFVESTAYQFVEAQPFISSQMLLHSFMQMTWYEYKTHVCKKNLFQL